MRLDQFVRMVSGCKLQAVHNNVKHVPYGKSCLTRLLADCMGYARSRVVLIATCRCLPFPSNPCTDMISP